MDIRRNFRLMRRSQRKRIINAIIWLKENNINGPTTPGGEYQKYVNWYSDSTPHLITTNHDYTATIPLSGFVTNDHIVSISFDSTNQVVPKQKILHNDYLNLKIFLNSLFVHEMDGALASQRINHAIGTEPMKIGEFFLNNDGTHLIITCKNSPYVIDNIVVKNNNVDTPFSFIESTSTGDPDWKLKVTNVNRNGPGFLPWNRAFLRIFEMDLKFADQQLGGEDEIGLPYWSWSVHNLSKGLKGYLWKDKDFAFGSDGNSEDPSRPNVVDSGPFKYPEWKVYGGSQDYITREIARTQLLGSNNPWSMPTRSEVDILISEKISYDIYPFNESSSRFSFRNRLEGWYGLYTNSRTRQDSQMTNAVHLFVGGTMTNPALCVNDPVFFLMMAYTDYIWSSWQKSHVDPKIQYPDYGPFPGLRREDELIPWGTVNSFSNPLKIEDLLSHDWTAASVSVQQVLGEGYLYK